MAEGHRGSGRRGPRFLAISLAGLAAAACSGGTAADKEETRDPARAVIFVFDRSASIEDYQLELFRNLVNQRIAGLNHGDRIAALQVLQLSLAEPPLRWSQPVPDREFDDREIARDSVTLARFLQDARDYLRPFSETGGRESIMGTDLLSTLHDVGEEVRAHRHHAPTLYLFSDMLQSNRLIEMEGLRRMPPDDWIETTLAAGLLPDMRGLCVVVLGARVDTEASQRVKTFWTQYFEVTGATLRSENYMHRPVSLPTEPCPGIQE